MKAGIGLAKSNQTTLCYIERDGQYLMMHRIRKKQDINQDKWVGIGGHFERMRVRKNVCCVKSARKRGLF